MVATEEVSEADDVVLRREDLAAERTLALSADEKDQVDSIRANVFAAGLLEATSKRSCAVVI